jgi:hypothetical protein
MSTSTAPAPAVKAPRKPKSAKSAPVVTLCMSIDHTVYGVERIPSGEFGTAAWRLSKKSNAGEVYDVIRDHDGLVQCDCPSYEVTFKGTCDTCKHGKALVALGLLDAPSPTMWIQPEDVAPVVESPVACCDPATEAVPCAACEPSPGFAEELHQAIGLPPVDPPADVEPLGWEKRPARSFLVAPKPSERPVKLPALPEGQYRLHELVEAQGAILRGQGGPVWDLMAKALTDLAASIRATGAQSVAEYEDRHESMEADRLAEIANAAFDRGFAQAEAQMDRTY